MKLSVFNVLLQFRKRARIFCDTACIAVPLVIVGWLEWSHPFPSTWFLLLTPTLLYAGTFYPDAFAWVLTITFPLLLLIIRSLHDPSAFAVALGTASWSVFHFGLCALLLSGWKSAVRRANAAAERDALTGAGNSTSYTRAAREAITSCRVRDVPLAIAFMDCDQFKSINDSQGHLAGDDLLRNLATIIRSSLGPADRLIRWGGDEFVLLLPDRGAECVREFLSQVCSALRNDLDKNSIRITFSWGVVVYDVPPDDVEAMLRDADRLMYEAKREGGDRVCFRYISRSG